MDHETSETERIIRSFIISRQTSSVRCEEPEELPATSKSSIHPQRVKNWVRRTAGTIWRRNSSGRTDAWFLIHNRPEHLHDHHHHWRSTRGRDLSELLLKTFRLKRTSQTPQKRFPSEHNLQNRCKLRCPHTSVYSVTWVMSNNGVGGTFIPLNISGVNGSRTIFTLLSVSSFMYFYILK